MFKVGDKVVVVSAEEYDIPRAGDVLTVWKVDNELGFWAKKLDGLPSYVKTEDMNGAASTIVRPYTETEAKRRGAKFGVMGVSKLDGSKVRFVVDDGKKSFNGKSLWVFISEERQSIVRLHPSEVRFDHEPEFVAWSEAPEELKYDASRVYHQGEPVKWIAKPEGVKYTDAVFVSALGNVYVVTDDLTVKL